MIHWRLRVADLIDGLGAHSPTKTRRRLTFPPALPTGPAPVGARFGNYWGKLVATFEEPGAKPTQELSLVSVVADHIYLLLGRAI
jgi:hypothetical protein